MAKTSTPYSTAKPLMGALPSWLGAADQERIEAYRVYEDMYWNSPDTFKLTMRGSEENPIYIPSARVIVEATNQFLAKDWDYVLDPTVGTPAERDLVKQQLDRLFKREMMWAKVSTQKRFGLIRGDAIWHIVGDGLKPQGTRLSIYEVDPAAYFPIYEDDNLDRLVGVHLVDQIEYEKKVVVRRQTYRKVPGTTQITTETALFEAGAWDDRDTSPYISGNSGTSTKLKLIKQLVPVTPLDPRITTIPVYQIKNNRTPASPFGSSELRGLEVLSSAVNQAVSDQALSLALDGLGLYATTSGPPTDEEGNEVNWILGPGKVVEIDAEASFTRVSGVPQQLPGLQHIEFLLNEQRRAAGVPDIAIGEVNVSVAESGVSLALKMGPLLAKNAEKEQELLGVYDHMLYDIVSMWLPVYEQMAPAAVQIASVVGDPMPRNREAEIKELIDLVNAKIISAAYARVKLTELGYEFPDEMGVDIVTETQALAEAIGYDPFAARVASELDPTQGA